MPFLLLTMINTIQHNNNKDLFTKKCKNSEKNIKLLEVRGLKYGVKHYRNSTYKQQGVFSGRIFFIFLRN